MADKYVAGDWNAACYECGRTRKASSMRRHWQGYYVCPEHWEAKHPQEFVRGRPESAKPSWVQPPQASFLFTDFILLDGVFEFDEYLRTEAYHPMQTEQ